MTPTPRYNSGDNGPWSEYRRMVMETLEDIRKDIREMDEELSALKEDTLRFKVIWSLATGLCGVLIPLGIHLLFKYVL